MSEISILLLGNAERSEFRRSRRALDRWGRVTAIPRAESAEAALAEQRIVADVIVVAQDHPGQFSRATIERLRRWAPLARVLGLMGSWCEGEMRTGRPWPGAVRVYWHQWPSRCDRQFGHILRGESSAWGLPTTASEEERLLQQTDSPVAPQRGLIAIYATSREMHDWLSAACRQRGCSTEWLRPPQPARLEGATAAIFDGSDCRGAELEQLEHLAAMVRPAPTIALLDFPRIEDHTRALTAGAAAVVSKPVDLDDLYWHLDRFAQ